MSSKKKSRLLATSCDVKPTSFASIRPKVAQGLSPPLASPHWHQGLKGCTYRYSNTVIPNKKQGSWPWLGFVFENGCVLCTSFGETTPEFLIFPVKLNPTFLENPFSI